MFLVITYPLFIIPLHQNHLSLLTNIYLQHLLVLELLHFITFLLLFVSPYTNLIPDLRLSILGINILTDSYSLFLVFSFLYFLNVATMILVTSQNILITFDVEIHKRLALHTISIFLLQKHYLPLFIF